MLRKLALVSVLFVAAVMSGCGDDDCPTCPKEQPILYLSKHKINFGSEGTTASFVISNKGKETLSWTITVSPASAAAKVSAEAQGGWLSLSQTSGSGDATITCQVNRANLTKLGVSRATLIIDSPNSVNATRDSVEVYILKAGRWFFNDDGTFETCHEVDSLDYYWVKEFVKPVEAHAMVVDSVRINFCQGDTTIELLAFRANVFDSADLTYSYPDSRPLYSVPEVAVEIHDGWNTIITPIEWYFTDSNFFIGYFQPGSTRPDLSIDTSNVEAVQCWRARDFSTLPDTRDLRWEWRREFETFAIRVFMTPVLEYYPKFTPSSGDPFADATPITGFAHKGKYPVCTKPQLVE